MFTDSAYNTWNFIDVTLIFLQLFLELLHFFEFPWAYNELRIII